MKKTLSRAAAAVLCLLLICLCALPANAAAAIDTQRVCSLRLNYQDGDKPLGGVALALYRVAEVSETAEFLPTQDFRAYPVTLNGLTQSAQWWQTAQALAGYVTADKLAPYAETTSNAAGVALFENLPTGLYLLLARDLTLGSSRYSFAAQLLSLPSLDEADNWSYELELSPKQSHEVPSDKTYSVVKKWADVGYESKRPQSVTIEIYRDGVLMQTCTLSQQNNWSYSWSVEMDNASWSVVEKDITGDYTVKVSANETAFTVINTYQKPGDPSLPQTGQEWVPVIALAAVGLALFSIGWMLLRRRKSDET